MHLRALQRHVHSVAVVRILVHVSLLRMLANLLGYLCIIVIASLIGVTSGVASRLAFAVVMPLHKLDSLESLALLLLEALALAKLGD